MSTESGHIRLRLAVSGVVQGVGFRPFVYTLARRFALAGFVGNDSAGAFIEIEGSPEALARFQTALRAELPPLAHIEAVTVTHLPCAGASEFVIVDSERQAGLNTLVSPDVAVCDDCLRELLDPRDRRYRYPFINCTNCGPRFTIIKDTPYDRPATTMAGFAMCPACAREYADPADRRFHAQPVACPQCGPQVWLQSAADARPQARGGEAIKLAQRMLRAGLIVAVKGIGGFHLACDATSRDAVLRLRARKRRGDKPFALMVADLPAARACADIDADEAALLQSRERPIVLLRRRMDAPACHEVAPGTVTLGVMLAYSPLHHLLLEDMPPLVMTSGNVSEEPIVIDNSEALTRLSGLADAFLMHDRDIYVSCDDSVVRVFGEREYPVRRSRGYAPFPVRLPGAQPSVLATGGELKAALCLTRDAHAFMSQHIGDMANLETLAAFDAARAHLQRLFRITPAVVACDRHPGYLSTGWAREFAAREGLPLVQVQHHHAHIAALMAEHGLDGHAPVLGVCFDGTGYGDDGAIWGGEVLIADYRTFRRAAHLTYVPQPGGDVAVRRPYRMALAHLWSAGIAWDEDLEPVRACPEPERRVLAQQLRASLNCAPTSSMGRLFDAAAALIGVQQHAAYEAQAAIEMEALAAPDVPADFAFGVDSALRIDPAPVLRALIDQKRAGAPVAALSGKFHAAVADLVLGVCLRIGAAEGVRTVALSGGVFQNTLLLDMCMRRLNARAFSVLTHSRVPPNDGGLALGQAVIAGRAQ